MHGAECWMNGSVCQVRLSIWTWSGLHCLLCDS